MSALVKSSLARKWVMALSGLFLVVFLTQHFVINITSVFAPDTFNEISHFMGYNPMVQFIAQPILIIGLIVHFIMGIVLELKNRSARPIKYAKFSGNANSQWVSRNMIITGLVVLAFLGLHMYDFWAEEIGYKYISANPEDPTRYYEELVHKFAPFWRTIIYVIANVLLAMHLWHGFNSSFQSMGAKAINKGDGLRKFTYAWSVIIPAGFIFIALFHHFSHS
ncbi:MULTISPECIES: succinate dehydrogenase cytochrome b subunit [Nonlabens]|uniref:Succinate dehydrogenase / fumarate reductase cytochrome b subunit n=1 Tax=Nonlabens xylanidelens TaxID=191564 RepID=A0A2S6IRC5_9FLAO|nr:MULTISPECIES: succinate dehydrogenase cytochrome b subunit [Nonlabens]PPK96758.1 succinate dehydrogenase / fumarate reductase cytochrome b subunit [Nonlabens xylanidelens]PQJ13465.1 succinate dehydrogenase [Nonlabens xylanidelens]WOI22425.1 succinate dehydrogenase cytochrome b subunit [Nonlabens ulvanivorans]